MARKKAKKSKTLVPEPDDLDWAYVYSNEKLREITKTAGITNFCKIQHLKYVAHVTRLNNDSFQKQLLFAIDHKKYSRDRWIKFEKELGLSKMQIQQARNAVVSRRGLSSEQNHENMMHNFKDISSK